MIFENITDLAEELATFGDVEDMQIVENTIVADYSNFHNILTYIRDNEISNVKLSIKGGKIKLTLS